MKRLILVLSIFAGTLASYAQSANVRGVFTFNNPDPTPVYRLGMDPEFPFLRNLTTPEKVMAAMQRSQRDSRYRRQATELNDLLKGAGFTRGIKDVTVASITPYDVDEGATGNMGSGNYNYIYARMNTGEMISAWKVTSDDGGYITFLSPCGNAFYPGSYVSPPAVSSLDLVPITAPSDTIAIEKTAEYTGEKKCDPCEPKETSCSCDDECDPCSYHHYRRHYARYCCGW